LPPRSDADQEIDKLHRAIDSTFIIPWDIYIDATKKLAIELNLQNISTNYQYMEYLSCISK
jgi:hypothetical protein